MLDEVSLPVRNTPSQPRNAATNGKTAPVLAKAMARLEVMPEKFIRYAMLRMNAIVTMGSASWRMVRPYTAMKLTRAPRALMKSQAAMHA